MSEERDKTWAKLIVKGLKDHPQQDRTNRPIWSWLQRDKLSSAWLQALPGPDTSLTSAEFSEAAAAALCLPSPACMEKLGQVIRGRQVVDLFGEAVQSTITTGDHYRKRHDAYKMRLFQMCQWAGLEAEVEVFNLLAGSIPQEGLSRMERGRKVQSIVPDMRISIPEEGNFVPRLHELKIISSSKTRYTSFLRRTLSVVGVRAQAKLLLGRLEVIGPGAGAAAGRRNYSLNLERIWANQRRADQLSRLQGKSILRRGQFKLD